MCAFERKPDWTTRVPDDVAFERVRIKDGGTGTDNSSLRIVDSGRVSATRITVVGAGAHGVNVSGSTAVTLVDVSVSNVPRNGFVLQGGTQVVDRITADGTGTQGLLAIDCARFDFGTIMVRNAATTDTASRWAVHVRNVARVQGTRLWVADTRNPPLGTVVRASGTQTGNLGTIVAEFAGLMIDNPSNLTYTLG
jgi:hypothetical protein